MALETCELVWLKHLLQELKFGKEEYMKLICDNQVAYILHLTKSFMREPSTRKWIATLLEIESRCMTSSFVKSNDQLTNIFIKFLRGLRIKNVYDKLGCMT